MSNATVRSTVMLDDLGSNLKPAQALGMATIKVADVDVALAELQGLVGFSLKVPPPYSYSHPHPPHPRARTHTQLLNPGTLKP